MSDSTKTADRLREVHNDKLCHICGLPRAGKGGPVCSYPHGQVPAKNLGSGMWTWEYSKEKNDA